MFLHLSSFLAVTDFIPETEMWHPLFINLFCRWESLDTRILASDTYSLFGTPVWKISFPDKAIALGNTSPSYYIVNLYMQSQVGKKIQNFTFYYLIESNLNTYLNVLPLSLAKISTCDFCTFALTDIHTPVPSTNMQRWLGFTQYPNKGQDLSASTPSYYH